MGYRNGDETVAIEAKVEHATAKAYLIELTLGGQAWLPKSQVVSMGEPDIDGNRDIIVTEWIAEKNGWV
jgi:hypothetical protein